MQTITYSMIYFYVSLLQQSSISIHQYDNTTAHQCVSKYLMKQRFGSVLPQIFKYLLQRFNSSAKQYFNEQLFIYDSKEIA